MRLPLNERTQSISEWRAALTGPGSEKPAEPGPDDTIIGPVPDMQPDATPANPSESGAGLPGPPERHRSGRLLIWGTLAILATAIGTTSLLREGRKPPAPPGSSSPGSREDASIPPPSPANAPQGRETDHDLGSPHAGETTVEPEQSEHSSPPPEAAVPETVPPRTAVNPGDISLGIAEALGGLECAFVEPALTTDARVILSGFVASDGDRDKVSRAIAEIAGISGVDTRQLSVFPPPFCRLISTLERATPADLASLHGVTIELNKPEHQYHEGEQLKVTVAASRLRAGYLYVDYLDSAGTVVHLLPSEEPKGNAVSPGQQLILGPYDIVPPHGRSLVTAIWVPHRLFDEMRPDEESLSDYLPALGAALNSIRAGGDPVVSRFEFLTTHK